MNKLISGVVSLAFAGFATVSSAEVGIGAAVRSDEASLYIPWQIGNQFRLEGELSLQQHEDDEDGVAIITDATTGAVVSTTTVPGSSQDFEMSRMGVGAFWTPELRPDWRLLAGLRLSRVEYESSFSTDSYSSRTDADGTEIAPTVGLEYSAGDKIKLALEYSYFIRELEGDSVTVNSGISSNVTSVINNEFEESGTRTRIVLRYFF